MKDSGANKSSKQTSKPNNDTNNSSSIELSQFFYNSIDMLCISDTNGYLLEVNPEWTKNLGYSRDELINQPFINFVHPDDVEDTIHATIEYAQQANTESFANRYRHKDGSYRWLEWRSYPANNLIYASARDITDRKLAELQIKEMMDLHTTIFDNAGYSIIVTDKSGLITNINPMGLKMLGYSANELINKKTANEIHDKNETIKHAEYLSQKLGHPVSAGFDAYIAESTQETPQEYEWTYIRKDGTRFPVSLKVTVLRDGLGAVKGYMGIAIDISQRKKIEEQLRRNEARLLKAQAMGKIGYSEHYLKDGTIWASAEGMRLYGFPPTAQMINLEELNSCIIDYEGMRKAVIDLIYHDKKFDIEYAINPKDGSPQRILHAISEVERDSDGTPISLNSIFLDITERKNTEQQLKENEKKLRNLVTNLDIVSFQTDKNGVFVLTEGKALIKLGLRPGDLVGQSIWQIYKDYPELLSIIKKGLAGSSVEAVTFLQNQYFETRLTPIIDANDTVTGLLGVAIDITDRRLAIDALRESEKLFSSIYMLTPDMVGISRLSDGAILNANPAFTQILGYEPDEYLEVSSVDLGFWAEIDHHKTMKDELLRNGEINNLESPIRKKNGEKLTCLFSAKPLIYNEEKCALFVIHDITERKNAEEEIIRNELRLQGIVNIMQFPSHNQQVFLDFTLDEALKLTQSKIGYIYLYHEEQQEFILNSWSKGVMDECSIVNPMSCYALEKTGLWGEAVRQRKPIIFNNFTTEHPLKKGYPEGHVKLTRFLTIPVFNNNQIVSVVGVANSDTDYNSTDILQLTLLMDAAWKIINNRMAEEALRISEQKYRKLFENMDSGFVFHEMVFDKLGHPVDFKYIDANSKFLEYWNVSKDIIGRNVLDVFSGIADQTWVETAWQVIQSGFPSSKTTYMPPTDMYLETIEFKVDDTHFATIFNDVTERVRTSNALKDSELRFRSIVENLPVALGVADLLGNIKYHNNTFIKFFGYSLEDIPTIQKWAEVAYPDPEYRRQTFDQWDEDVALLEKGEVSFSRPRLYKICNKAGQYLDVEITFTIINNEIYSLFNNISERVKAEEELRSSQQKFSDIYAMIPDAIGIVQLSDGRIIEANPASFPITGYSPEEYIGKTTQEIGLWDDPNQRVNLLAELAIKGEILNREVELRIKNGKKQTCLMSLKPIDYQGKKCMLFIINNITELKNTERALLSEKTFTSSLLDSVPGLVYMYDENFSLVRWNKKHETETGYTADELNGKSILSWFDAENQKIIKRSLDQILDYGYAETEAAITFRSGEVHLFYFSARKSHIDNQSYITGIALDITERKQANENLRQLEQRFQNIYNLTPDMVGITRISDGKILSGNPAVSKLTGYTPEEYSDRTTMELNWWANPADRTTMLRALKETGEITNFEIGMRRKEGVILNCLFSAKTLNYNNEPCLLFVVHDITEIKKTEIALQKRVIALTKPLNDPEGIQFTDLFNIEDLQNIQDAFADATGVASLITYPDGTPITKPSNFCQFCKIVRSTPKGSVNCSKSDAYLGMQNHAGPTIQPCLSGGLWDAGASITLGGRHMANWLIGQVRNEKLNESALQKYALDIEANPDELKQAFENVSSMSIEQFEKVANTLHILANELSIKAFQNIQQARFITEQKQIAETLLEKEYFLRRSQEVARIGSYILHIENLDPREQVWQCTPVMDDIFGIDENYPKSGYNWLHMIVEWEEIERYLIEIVLGKKEKFRKEYRITRPNDGEIRWVFGFGEVEYTSTGKPVRLIGTIQDITARKTAEEEIRQLNTDLEHRVFERTAQLEQANKDLEAFAYSVSHDLRAPLRHIDGFARLLYSNIEKPGDKISDYFNKINAASSRMSNMIDDLLSFSRLGRKEISFSIIDINEILKEIIEQLRPDLANREIQWQLSNIPNIRGDRNLLRMAFENLISNAIKYTSRTPVANIEIGYTDNPKSYEIYIKDNGVGFDMTYSPKLFGVFQRLHNSEEFEGTGIGLANVKQIIAKHNGTIRAEGKLNEGAIFYVTLPK